MVLFIQKSQGICAKANNYMQSSFSWRMGAGKNSSEEYMHQCGKEGRAAVFSRTRLLLIVIIEFVIMDIYACFTLLPTLSK